MYRELICLIFTVQLAASELQDFSLRDVQETIKRSHLLLSLRPRDSDAILKTLSWLFQNESIEFGIWNPKPGDVIKWKHAHEGENLAFFEKRLKDRRCLVKPNLLYTPTAVGIDGDDTSLADVVKFLNDACFAFVTPSGRITRAGKVRHNILKNIFRVTHSLLSSSRCERISPPTMKEFVTKYMYRSRPVIIENAINHWPALKDWSNEFLRRKYGNQKVHVKMTPNGEFEGCDEARKFENFDTFRVPKHVRDQLQFPDLVVVRPAVGNIKFSEFLDLVENKNNSLNISAYLEYSSIREYFPELEKDVKPFTFVDGILKSSSLNIWLSNGNTLGKLHFDPFENFLCQMRGNKKLTLFDPHQNHNLYEAHIQEGLLGYEHNTNKFSFQKLLDSTSMVMSPVDILNPNFERFPNFTRAEPMECYLNEGDVLYMPSFWWHEVQSYPNPTEKRNLAVNFWYYPFLTKEFPCAGCKLDVNPLYRKILELF
ncbi:bifunctional peptidase and (3S)-lysyl hydroxylase JMJD7-like [Hydractinia symbiolongicarpus]|uniref:bifunctional peptidase and (3S)-lysyl hydroxylase JMJD7-like n=1 Tax=Hydractinia symbiolongicarpus TaxID=13093 RepID=UPI00254E5D9E|nr:bifunctional peptidase and (3S)-lysyl hydroxylase JMJD7-like [Hydractinia symbiolongicarpus]